MECNSFSSLSPLPAVKVATGIVVISASEPSQECGEKTGGRTLGHSQRERLEADIPAPIVCLLPPCLRFFDYSGSHDVCEESVEIGDEILLPLPPVHLDRPLSLDDNQ